MTLAVLGSESFSFSNGNNSEGLTIPSGTRSILLCASGDAVNNVPSFVGGYLGSSETPITELVDIGYHGAVVGTGWAAWVADARGRASDTLVYETDHPGTCFAIYISGNVPLAEGSVYDSNGWTSDSQYTILSGTPAVSGGNRIVWGAGNQFGGAAPYTIDDGTSLNGSSNPVAAYHLGTADETMALKITPDGGFFGHFAAAAVYESVVVPNIAPDPINPELAFNAGAIATSGPVALYGGSMRAFVFAFNAGLLGSYAKRQVALVGEDIQTPEMTVGGNEGDILTQHADIAPTWEPPSAHAHDYSGELLITDEPAGTPLVFADILQNEDQDDLVYEDVNP